jgi:N-acetylglucosamine-6-phosphate deacetylase
MIIFHFVSHSYTFGSLSIDIVGATAKIVGSDTLAGSVARLDACVRNFKSFTSCSHVEAIEAASLHPVCISPSHAHYACACVPH